MKFENNELFLDRKELIYLVRLTGSQTVIGMDMPELKQDKKEIDNLLAEAEKSLVKADVIEISQTQGVSVEEPILQMIEVVAKRSLAILTIRSIRGKGQQLFVHNFLDNLILEHTLPQENMHRLAFVKNQDAFYERLRLIFPLHPVDQKTRKEFVIKEKLMQQIKDNLLQNNLEAPEKELEKLGMPREYRQTMLNALKTPQFTASAAAFLMRGDEIKDASSFSVVGDQESSWGIWPHKLIEKDPEFLIFPSGITDVLCAFKDWISLLTAK